MACTWLSSTRSGGRTTTSTNFTSDGRGSLRRTPIDPNGLPRSIRYEVMCPQTGAVLASLGSLRAARRFVIARELNEARADGHSQRTMLIA